MRKIILILVCLTLLLFSNTLYSEDRDSEPATQPSKHNCLAKDCHNDKCHKEESHSCDKHSQPEHECNCDKCQKDCNCKEDKIEECACKSKEKKDDTTSDKHNCPHKNKKYPEE